MFLAPHEKVQVSTHNVVSGYVRIPGNICYFNVRAFVTRELHVVHESEWLILRQLVTHSQIFLERGQE
jgi:hypothetical protein